MKKNHKHLKKNIEPKDNVYSITQIRFFGYCTEEPGQKKMIIYYDDFNLLEKFISEFKNYEYAQQEIIGKDLNIDNISNAFVVDDSWPAPSAEKAYLNFTHIIKMD